MRLTAAFNVRGGIDTQIIAERRATGWRAPERVVLP
jgi:7-cyano-7-deazaguanine reductase